MLGLGSRREVRELKGFVRELLVNCWIRNFKFIDREMKVERGSWLEIRWWN